MFKLRTFLLLPIVFLAVDLSFAQRSAAGKEASFSLRLDKTSVPVGETFRAIIHARVEPGWHMYSTTQAPGGPIPTTIRLGGSPVFEAAGDLKHPVAQKSFDQNFDIDTEYFEGDVQFELPVRSKAAASPGKHEVAVKIRYMLCSDTMCLPPQTEELKAQVTLLAPTQSTKAAPIWALRERSAFPSEVKGSSLPPTPRISRPTV